MSGLHVLIACEYSGTVRDAFRRLGHEALSCDLLPSDAPGPHYRGDVRELLKHRSWNLVIAHPPCTYLCSSGLHWNKRRPERAVQTEEALEFVRLFMDLSCPHAIENPVGCISSRIRKPEQIIQPWQFGHPESKATCLWLKGIPPLVPTNVLPKPSSGRWENQTASGQNTLGPTPDRWKLRSTTYKGIADAMARQWSSHLLSMI